MRLIKHAINPKLHDLCRKSMQLEKLNELVQTYLPEELRTYCAVGSFHMGCLNLVVTDAVWASSLRFCLPELRDKLRSSAGMYQLGSIKITIQTNEKSIVKKTSQSKELSAKAINSILTNAELCTYQPLREALIALGKS